MPNLLEYFNNDFKDLSFDTTFNIEISDYHKITNEQFNKRSVEIKQRIRINVFSSTRLFTFYVPATFETFDVIQTLLNEIDNLKIQAEDVNTYGYFKNDTNIGRHKNIYSNRIYFYIETPLSKQQLNKLDEIAKAKDLFLTVRSQNYVLEKLKSEHPIAFISHDSRDKELIAGPLANSLNSRHCFVWYDEFSLKIGDSLRASIEKGIKEAKKCIVILSKNYLTNPGWSKKEFDSIFTRELIKNEKVILPVWCDVAKEEVYEYSPSLADTVALKWPSSQGKTDSQYRQEYEKLISKIHLAVTSPVVGY
jgi:hypothetical protein